MHGVCVWSFNGPRDAIAEESARRYSSLRIGSIASEDGGICLDSVPYSLVFNTDILQNLFSFLSQVL